ALRAHARQGHRDRDHRPASRRAAVREAAERQRDGVEVGPPEDPARREPARRRGRARGDGAAAAGLRRAHRRHPRGAAELERDAVGMSVALAHTRAIGPARPVAEARPRTSGWRVYLALAAMLAPLVVPSGPAQTAALDVVNLFALAAFVLLVVGPGRTP